MVYRLLLLLIVPRDYVLLLILQCIVRFIDSSKLSNLGFYDIMDDTMQVMLLWQWIHKCDGHVICWCLYSVLFNLQCFNLSESELQHHAVV